MLIPGGVRGNCFGSRDLFHPGLIIFDDEIIDPVAGEDHQVFLLYELQYIEEKEYSMDTILANIKYLFERKRTFHPGQCQDILPRAFHRIIIADYRVDRLISLVVEPLGHLFEGLHQLE